MNTEDRTGLPPLEEMQQRVKLVEPGIVWYDERSGGTPKLLAAFGELIDKVGAECDHYVLIIDLTDAGQPDPDYRDYIVQFMKERTAIQIVYLQPTGMIARVALRFMASRAGTRWSVHATKEQVMTKARELLTAAKQ